MFDGDNNEPDSAPFSQLIRALIVKNRIVMAVNKHNPAKYHNKEDMVSKSFVKGWTVGTSEPYSLPYKSDFPLRHRFGQHLPEFYVPARFGKLWKEGCHS